MQQKKINPIIQWWVTPKLPYHDIFELPLLINKNKWKVFAHLISNWFIHPIKRRIAKRYLEFLQQFTDIKVVAITGSSGKTITTQMLASICSLEGNTVWSRESIDPVYNIPNTILRVGLNTKYLILEMGVEYPGEMDFYLWLVKPDIGVITNIFPTHLEFLGDMKGVFMEKSKLVLGLSKDNIAILNSDDKNLKSLVPKIKAKIEWFKHNDNKIVEDGCAAAVVADSLEINKKKIFKGLKYYEKPRHRLSFFRSPLGAVILDDSYNSNPEALLSTLKFFAKKAGNNNKIAILGDMRELGEFEEKFHRDIGRVIAKQDFQTVIGIGDPIKYLIDEVNKSNNYTKAIFVKSLAEAIPLIKPYLIKDNYILIKGSRSIGLDKLVDALV